MFDHYYGINHSVMQENLKTEEETAPVNLCFLRLKSRGKGKFTACILKMLIRGQRPNFILTLLINVCYRTRYRR